MTERHPAVRHLHPEEVALWHPFEGSPTEKKVAVGCSVDATIETRGSAGSRRPEGD
ncbi:hypothetical protein SAMN04488546_1492 [Geodermatophilus poikilotrophus]|uniref:Uncharacterized protein n=1 Tax=Geodermatophilus poikilotrophus TaxID=1333667 RepID=A0A1I0BXT9_9ACTN|nr:hypothetical protein SAMN04488546_1492 [Geodermatophilus poikilotrophus]